MSSPRKRGPTLAFLRRNRRVDSRLRGNDNKEELRTLDPRLRGNDSGIQSPQTSSQVPWVAALEYSVARFSKKLVCSMPFSMSSIQGIGLRSTR